ncbi:hypothetical protein BHM03_00058261 [Ensete ventricosum]|nr:hypothetical protein BHM03_00058261 [Ensete ventricosum]
MESDHEGCAKFEDKIVNERILICDNRYSKVKQPLIKFFLMPHEDFEMVIFKRRHGTATSDRMKGVLQKTTMVIARSNYCLHQVGTLLNLSKSYDERQILKSSRNLILLSLEDKADLKWVEARGKGEGELDYHVVVIVGEDAGENEVRGDRDEDVEEVDDGLGDNCVLNVRLIDAHPPKSETKAPELVVNVGEATCLRHSARQ